MAAEHAARRAVVGGGAAGLYAALTAAEARRRGDRGLAEAAERELELLGPGRPRGRDRRRRLARAARRGHARRRARAPAAARLPRCSRAEAPGVVAELERRGVEFDRDPDGELGAGPRGGPLAPARRPRRRRRDRPPDHRAARGARRGRAADRRSPRATSALALWSDGEPLPRRRSPTRSTVARRATVLATGGAAALWARTTNPWGAIGAGPVMAERGRRRARRPGALPVPPDRAGRAGHRGRRRCWSPRPSAARARRCSTPTGERFTDELAPRDAVTLAILDRMERGRARPRPARPARPERGALPERVRGPARGRATSRPREPVPVAPASHYVMGGVATDLEGRSSLPGLLAVGECACTGPARRQPARLELASRECFVLGARAAAAACERARRGRGRPSRRTGASSRRRPRPATRSGGSPGPRRRREELERLLERPLSACAADRRASRSRARSRAARTAGSSSPSPTPALDERHLVAGGDELRWELASWDVALGVT